MSGAGSGPLVPTFTGFVQNSMDGLMLFEACLSGKLHHVPRRPHDRERSNLIKSGSIFIYEENASGIKRWTDGVAWSPSRILGNFLIYRELEKPFPPGEKKRAMKRKRSSQIDDPTGRRTSEDRDGGEPSMPPTPPSPKLQTPTTDASGPEGERELDRQLIGSLVDSYGFRPDGLVKKTMSIAINGVSHHLVSYYKVEDVKARRLMRPLDDPRMQNMAVRPELYLKQNFRTPVEETETYVVDPHSMHAHPGAQHGYAMMPPGYAMRPGQYMPSYPMYPTNVPVSSGGVYQSQLPPAHAYGQAYNDYYKQPTYGNSTPTSAAQHGASATPYQHPSSANTHHSQAAQSPYQSSATSHHGTNSPAQQLGSAPSHHASHSNSYHASSPHQQVPAGSQDGVGGMQHVNSGSYDMYDRRTTGGYGTTGTTYPPTGQPSYTATHGGTSRMW